MAQDLQTNGQTKFPRKAHLLFEQSGTFKKAFMKYGIPAEDYDILNGFGETDHQIDLFQEIRKAYTDEPSIFDTFGEDDVVMAFFPCVRFEDQILISFRGQASQMKNWDLLQKMEYDIKLQNELTNLYELINKLFIICIRRGLKLIVENPYSEQHYLKRCWCLPATLIDKDRRDRGDYYKKPTQYWFINCEPKYNFIFEAQHYNALNVHWDKRRKKEYLATGAVSQQVSRSMIHPDYAERFIREFIIEK